MTPSPEGSAASAHALPRSAVRRSVLQCAELLAHTASLARIAAECGRPNHGAGYLLATVDELAAQLDALRAHLKAAPPTDP